MDPRPGYPLPASIAAPLLAATSPREEPIVGPEPWLGRLTGCRSAPRLDERAAHEIRVTCGRLRVWLTLGRRRALRDDLGWLRKEAAEVRDIDVQLGLGPPRAWAARLRGARDPARRRLARAVAGARFATTIGGLRVVPPVPRAAAWKTVSRLLDDVLDRGRCMRQRWDDVRVAHALRGALRRLRYALEWLGDRPERIIALQELLGEACDRNVALAVLGRRRARPENRRYADRLQEELDEQLEQAHAAWRALRPELRDLRLSARRRANPAPARPRRPSPVW